jgi:hypothetical protein
VLGAAAIEVTLFGTSFLPGDRGAASRTRLQVTIGRNAIYHRNHAKGAWS